jgi:hypothetical protein
MDIRASRCAIWKLHAPPSREADINLNPKKGGSCSQPSDISNWRKS